MHSRSTAEEPAGSLTAAACAVLATAEPEAKATMSLDAARAWRAGEITVIGDTRPPERPARPARPELRPPRDMPRRRAGRGPAARIALLHALAHIELNAVDLAWDLIARFPHEAPPRDFFDDWVRVAAEEACHFQMLTARLEAFGAVYGDLPAHDGLWQAAAETAPDMLARLAIVPMVLEARGLDVTPDMIVRLRGFGDTESAGVLERIYEEEVGHVAIGVRWFAWLCEKRGHDPGPVWQKLVRLHFRGAIKPPFNTEARTAAGMPPDFYGPLAAGAIEPL